MSDLEVRYYPTVDAFAAATGASALELSDERSFVAELRGAGQASFTIQNDAPLLPQSGGVLQWLVKGTEAFASLLKIQDRASVAEKKADEKATWDTPGHLAIYKDHVIFPPNGTGRDPRVDSFAYNWTHPAYDDSAWSAATNIDSQDVDSAKLFWPITSQQPWGDVVRWDVNMPGDTRTKLVGPSGGTLTSADPGDYYLRDTFTAPLDLTYMLYVTIDNQGEVFIDGASVTTVGGSGNVRTSGFTSTTEVPVSLSAGEHTIAIKATNLQPTGGPNPTAVAAVIFIPSSTPPLIWSTTTAMKILEYPDKEPGMTFTTVLRLITEEAQALGRLGFIDISGFSDTLDSAGATIEDFVNITVTVGQDTALDVIAKIQESYGDVRMNPNGWGLEAYIFGTLAPASGVTYDATNIHGLGHKTEDPPADELLVLSALGYTRVGTGQHCAFLELGTEITADDVGTISTALLARMGVVREQVTVDPIPPSIDLETPWKNPDFVPGAIVTAPLIDGSPSAERCLSVGCSLTGDDEKLVVQVILKDKIEDANERVIQELKT